MLTALITFETMVARGFSLIRIRDRLIWTLLTSAAELKGQEEPLGYGRPLTAKHGSGKGRMTWREEREQEAAKLSYKMQPYAVIIGGGQGGIALGARLRQLGVPTIIVEKERQARRSAGASATSLCACTIRSGTTTALPAVPPNWPVFSPKDKIGDWLEMYTKIMELNYRTKTTCKSANFGDKTREWTSVVDRDGEEVVLKPKQLIMETVMSGKANARDFPAERHSRVTNIIPRSIQDRTLTGSRRPLSSVQQFGTRYLRSALGSRCRCHDGRSARLPISCAPTR